MSQKLSLTAYFDLICPWCLIGKRHLTSALAMLRRQQPGVEVEIEWRPHILLPGTPMSGIPYQAFYERRLGSKDAARPAGRRCAKRRGPPASNWPSTASK